MAAEYEVNIKLNTGKAETQLKNIESSITKVGKAEKQSASTTDRRVAAMVKLRNIGNDVAALESKGLDVSKAKFQLTKASEAIDKKMFLTANSRMGVVVKELGAQRNITKELERQEKARRRQRTKRAEGVALGAGFPLLFGGGAGSVLGGAAGGLTGSFGAQIALSAIGQQVDKFVAGTVEVGRALNSTGGTLDLVREKSLFSSSAVEERAAALEELGKVEELAALLTKELTGKIGNEGVSSLQELGKTTDKTTRLWSELTTQLFALVSGPLNDFLKIVNQVLGSITSRGRFEGVSADFAGNKAFEAAVRDKRKARGKGARLGSLQTEDQQDLVKRALAGEFGKVARPAQIPVTAEDRRRFAGKSDKAAKDAERLARRLAGLDAERAKLEQLLQLDQQINTAKLQGDNRQVIALENEARLIAFAEKEAVIRASKVPQEQKIAELKSLGLEKDRALLENAFKLDSFDKQKADDLTSQLKQIDLQLEAATAVTREAENQAKLELLLLNLRESNKNLTEDQEDQLKELMDKTKKLFEAQNQGPLQSFITNSVKSLNDLEQHAVQVSQGIGNAIGNSLVSGMQGLITGATSVKQVFADMLKSIADVLAQQASQMIATYIAIGIARAFAGMGDFNSAAASPGGSAGVKGIGGGMTNPFGNTSSFGTFAEGGYVNKPTNALIGEGGEPEYVIPESKMRESMSRYSRGSRGNSVIPTSGGGAEDSGGGTAVAAPIDVRYSVERINNVDYVTADQFQSGMRNAAEQGAQRGEQNTLRRLQMSGSTRKRLGL